MSTVTENLPTVINWKISLKNGASIDLNVRDHDDYDNSLRVWVDKLADGQRKYFFGSFEQGDIWVSPEEFSMALRAPYRQPAQVIKPEFDRVIESPSECV